MFQLVTTVSDWLDFSPLSTAKFNIFKKYINRYKTWKMYKDTVNELSSLSDKELADIGISRGMIHSIAMEVYYDNLEDHYARNSNLRGWV